MELITPRLLLKPIDMSYAEEVFKHFNPEVCGYMYPKPANDISETVAFIQMCMDNYHLGKEIVFAALLKETNEFIGCMGIHNIDTEYPELGVWLKISAHGHGYGKEGMNKIIDYAKANLQIKSIVYPVDRRNIPSRKIPESNGGIIVNRYHKIGAQGNELELIEYRIPVDENIKINHKKPLIVFDGDSITDTGRDRSNPESLGNGYAHLFGKYFPDALVRNLGISGHRSKELLERWQDTLDLKPDILSILIGINDIWHFYKHGKELGKDEFFHNLNAILQKAKEQLPNCKIILVEPFVFPIGHYELAWQLDLNKEIKIVNDLAHKYDCIHIPMQSSLDCFAQSYQMINILHDGVHPTEFGHKLMTNVMIKELSKLVEDYYNKN